MQKRHAKRNYQFQDLVQSRVMATLSGTRCEYVPVRSTAASLRPTVPDSAATTRSGFVEINLRHLFCLLLCVLAVVILTAPAYAQEIDTARQHELINLLKQDCGSCHGLTLQGGLGPALTVKALSDKPKDAMVATIINGRPGTPMPPWGNQLTEAETRWLVDNLYQGIK